MEKDNNTLSNWIQELEKKIKDSNLLDFSIDNINSLRIMKDDFISLFNDTLKAKSFNICKLDNFLSLSQAISSYGKNYELKGNELFTNLNEKEQQEVLKNIKEKQDEEYTLSSTINTYLCFGLLRYTLDVFASSSKQAPLIFVPVKLSYDEETKTYSFKGIEGEIYVNNLLLTRIKKVRRIDLSYPIDENFSISDYLYYISIKIQTLNWNLSNYVFLSNFDLSTYEDYLLIKDHQEEINSHEIIKKISYFNAEFNKFKEENKKPLDSKFLSLLDMNNEEYHILKMISMRDNLFIRANNQDAKIHLLSNTLLSYVLNNHKTLVVYSKEEEKEELLHYIEDQGYLDYVCDLNPLNVNKMDLLSDIVNYDKKLLPYNKVKQSLVNDDIQDYYNYKNNYKKLANSLRTIDNPIHISLNKLVNEYYRLDKYPLINITLMEPNRLTNEDLSRYMNYILEFGKKITALGCPINEHPFYGFERKIMKKEDYKEFKTSATELSLVTHDIQILIDLGYKKYHYPRPTNLKEIKALLNVLSFIDDYDGKIEWINDEKIKNKYNELSLIRATIETLNKKRLELINKYTRKIQYISEEIINEYLKDKNPKVKQKIRKLLGKQVPLSKIDGIVDELNTYYSKIHETKVLTETHDEYMINLMRNNELNILENHIRQIFKYRSSLRQIKDNNDFDASKFIKNKDKTRLLERRALQNAYNKLLKNTTIIQKYINKDLYYFKDMNLDKYEEKVTSIAKNFIKINDYTSYYQALLETNEFIPSLGNELIKAGSPKDFKNIFLKKFYYDVINERITSNKLLKENTRTKFYEELSKYSYSDEKRKEMITRVISYNIDSYLKRNLLRLRQEESDYIYQFIAKNPKLVSSNMITTKAKSSLYNTKPIVLVPYKLVSRLLKDDLYKYDLCVFLPRKHMNMIDILPCLVKSSTCIVFDEDYVSSDPRKSIKYELRQFDNNFIENCKNSYRIYSYTSDTRNIIIHNSPLDTFTKLHIAKYLVDRGFDVRVDYPIKTYIIDILVRVPNTKNTIAIELNHLPYNSTEDTANSFQLEDNLIQDLGFIPYRIFTVSYFFNEEIENSSLIDFIVKKSDIIDQEKIKKKEILLMDYLFKPYTDPHLIYYRINKNLTMDEIISKMIDECAPINIHELSNIVSFNVRGSVKRLTQNEIIYVEDNFIYKNNAPVEFRRVNRDENILRTIKNVSKKEIYDAIYKIVKHQIAIDQEIVIKMILLSLGYKKMNKENTDYIISCIDFLLKEKIIFNVGTTLYRDLQD